MQKPSAVEVASDSSGARSEGFNFKQNLLCLWRKFRVGLKAVYMMVEMAHDVSNECTVDRDMYTRWLIMNEVDYRNVYAVSNRFAQMLLISLISMSLILRLVFLPTNRSSWELLVQTITHLFATTRFRSRPSTCFHSTRRSHPIHRTTSMSSLTLFSLECYDAYFLSRLQSTFSICKYAVNLTYLTQRS